jgi:TolA-binding protein
MSADGGIDRHQSTRQRASVRLTRSTPATLAALAAVVFAVGHPAVVSAQDGPTPEEAVERARALERGGHAVDALSYLEDLVAEDGGPLAEEPEVLLEAARLANTAEQVRALARRALESTRTARILYAAHVLMGDSYFAQAMYQSASIEYEQASRHSPGRGPGEAELKRARSVLASGDAEEAVAAFRDIVVESEPEGDMRPQAELGLAISLMEAGRPEEAGRQFEDVAESYPEHDLRAQALAGAAESYIRVGDLVTAAAVLEQLEEGYPGTYEGVVGRERLRDIRESLPDTLAAANADSVSKMPAP